ncbi:MULTISPECIES: MaoC/PaaZ C-terminal domain-containing protein [Bacillaceae]|uniref:Enoyl-CoA hydratase n=1 Tax=Evansella alkalicola TaxID=745819 RepID=A0ABS6JRU8_9BACI|nr:MULTISPECIES: MaoC/PaaZ C-terminal domain-containing protein [Bacillaceae]MBU9721150.1 enoyl-CoA hydratase [Bacillus alkalicola]
MFTKKRKIGKTIDELKVGDKIEITKEVEDKDILLYLGFTDDANPVYIQHDYASRTPYEKPIVPQIMMNGFVSSVISMYLPGPGSVIKKVTFSYPKPLYHYGTLHLNIEISSIDDKGHTIYLNVIGKDDLEDIVLDGAVEVCPPYPWKPITYDAGTFENF